MQLSGRTYNYELRHPRKNHATKPPFLRHRLPAGCLPEPQSEHKNVRLAPKFLGPRN